MPRHDPGSYGTARLKTVSVDHCVRGKMMTSPSGARRHLAALAMLLVVFPAVRSDAASPEPADYEILQVDVKTPAQLEQLQATGGRILDCIPHPGKMEVLVTPKQRVAVDNLRLPMRVLKRNVSLKPDVQELAIAGGDPFADFFLNYRPYGDAATPSTIRWYLNELATRYPTLASVIAIGTTLEGRTIYGLRIANDATGSDKPAVVYFGAEHAREWIASHITSFFATHLLENYGSDPVITDMVDNVEFFLVPVFNVDGYLYTWSNDRYWRKNRRYNGTFGGVPSYGVDLNRNWSEGWGLPGASGYPDDETYRGAAPFSEPETQDLRDFFIAHPNVRAQLDLHSYTQLILWPHGYTAALPPHQFYYNEVGGAMQSLVKGVHDKDYAMGPIYTTIYPASGGSVDWTYAQQGILSYSFEMRPVSSFEGGFELPIDQIIPACEELVPAILHLTNTEWVRDTMRFEFVNGRPGTLTPGVNTVIDYRILGQTDVVDPAAARLFFRYDPAASFTEAPAQWLGGNDFRATLPATNCLSSVEYYFSAQDQSGTSLVNPRAAPAAAPYLAKMVLGAAGFATENFDTNPGWITQGQWAFGQPTGGGGAYGGPDPTSGHTGSNVYGYNLNGDYTANLPETHLTTTPFDCTGQTGVHLTYWRWLGVEQPAYDHAYVRVSADGVIWTTVWSNTTEYADAGWIQEDIDLSAVADNQPTVYIRWTMGASDSGWEYCGWNIDDVALYATTCDPVYGDYEADGTIGMTDYDEFLLCYTGDTGPVPPGCAIFDFDSDGTVDCDDWSAFDAAWNAGGSVPEFTTCAALPAPTVTAEGSRYLGVTCPAGFAGVAVRITSPDYPCLEVYAGTDGLLHALPVTGPSDDWTQILVGDQDIVPATRYQVAIDFGSGTLSNPVEVTTLLWGDCAAPFGEVDFHDIAGAVKCFVADADMPPAAWCDIYPEIPDRSIDFKDIAAVVKSFITGTYAFSTPSCP